MKIECRLCKWQGKGDHEDAEEHIQSHGDEAVILRMFEAVIDFFDTEEDGPHYRCTECNIRMPVGTFHSLKQIHLEKHGIIIRKVIYDGEA